MADITSDIWQIFAGNLAPIAAMTTKVLTKFPADTTPLWALLCLPFGGVIALAVAQRRRMRLYRFRRVFAAMISSRYLMHPSHRIDILFCIGNAGLFAVLVAQFIVSVAAIHALVMPLLVTFFGPVVPSTIDPTMIALIWAVSLYFAYEFAYWLDHYLAHKIPVLWEFHKVHHSAEVLSPLTNARVHPVDSLVFMNIVAIVNGLASGVLTYWFGGVHIALQSWGIMSAIGVAMMLIAQAQHSHIWLPFRGWLGCLLLSPAHHQIHHSVDPKHHDRNFGNAFGGFDWLFGTLYIPPQKRPKLIFGVDTLPNPEHTLKESLLDPFAAAAAHVLPQRVAPLHPIPTDSTAR